MMKKIKLDNLEEELNALVGHCATPDDVIEECGEQALNEVDFRIEDDVVYFDEKKISIMFSQMNTDEPVDDFDIFDLYAAIISVCNEEE